MVTFTGNNANLDMVARARGYMNLDPDHERHLNSHPLNMFCSKL